MKTTALILTYLAAIIAANQIITEYGPSAVLYVGAGLIAFNLVARDALHDIFQHQRFAKMALLIGTGAMLSYALNADAAQIATASAIAFGASEAIDALSYHAMRWRPWLERCNTSNVLSATVDTIIFFQLAFGGVPVALAFAQVCAKVAGGVIYSLLMQRRRQSALLPRHA